MSLRLDDRHKKIIETGRHSLVLGGPGSGKTTLALLVAENRIEQGLSIGQSVLFLSFSRAAVMRIQDAMSKSLPAPKRVLLQVQTFHSFFWSVLQAHGYLLGAPRVLSIVPSHDEKAMCNGIKPGHEHWQEWENARRQLFTEKGRVCFDLFAPLTQELFTRSLRIADRVSTRFPLIVVDEAQDTGTEQWACVKSLSSNSRLVCLADLDQLIFDHLPGVGPERVAEIRSQLNPVEIDLGSENNRSPGTEIAIFARDILKGVVRGAPYANVKRFRFKSEAAERDKMIRQGLGFMYNKLKEINGKPAESIAVIASYSRGVSVISAALRQNRAIPHQVLFDEAFVLLASKIGAFLLEPRSPEPANDLCVLLELLADAYRAKGGVSALKNAATISGWAAKQHQAKPPRTKLVKALCALLEAIATEPHSGNPSADWIRIKKLLRVSAAEELRDVAEALDYLIAYNRGQRISSRLSEVWLERRNYQGAREALEDALAQEQLSGASDSIKGIHVMNIHKCKGKQFDGVVLYRQQHHSPFVWPNDPEPHAKSRRILHVAISRARSFVLILDEAYSNCPIVGPHQL
jgi:DNA helicase-2/ATP-dependent DNA helicase PcrA